MTAVKQEQPLDLEQFEGKCPGSYIDTTRCFNCPRGCYVSCSLEAKRVRAWEPLLAECKRQREQIATLTEMLSDAWKGDLPLQRYAEIGSLLAKVKP